MAAGATVIVGGTRGIGPASGEQFARRQRDVVITGRDWTQTVSVAREIGSSTILVALDLTEPEQIASALEPVGTVVLRCHALPPGIVGDSPVWVNATEMLERVKERTPIGRLVTVDEVTSAAVSLLENTAVNGVNLAVDGGWVMA